MNKSGYHQLEVFGDLRSMFFKRKQTWSKVGFVALTSLSSSKKKTSTGPLQTTFQPTAALFGSPAAHKRRQVVRLELEIISAFSQ